MFDFFKKNKKTLTIDENLKIFVDFHSHLLPGIDDGCATLDESVENILELQSQGIKKIITTPHIFSEAYPNTPEIINEKLELLKSVLAEKKIEIEITAAAEYYLDEWFCKNYKNLKLLTIKENHLLVETNYMEKPYFMEQILFDLQLDGYKIILAHPERYNYLLNDFRQFDKFFDTGILFQCNLLSFTGYYSPQIKKAALHLLKNKMIHLVGSDIHKLRHTKAISAFKKTNEYSELLNLGLMNNELW
ncbi:MAG: capsular biosynthesis protein [Bacteroidetes bacterium]|nr:capsular biosynthesis protein [Bacteroidota bacterium]